jgi:hypothetical protein
MTPECPKQLTIFMFENFASKLHPAKFACGVPQLFGSGFPDRMLPGTLSEGKYQILIPDDVQSVAYTPPPLALKEVP